MTKKSRTDLDPLFKQVLIWLGQAFNFTPKTQVEVSRLPRTIDAVLELPDPNDQMRLAQLTPFTRLREHNQIEFKGKNDHFGLPNYHMVRGRCRFYMADKKLKAEQMTITVVCARRPNAVFETASAEFVELGDGYYLGNELLPTLIIVINELRLIPKNYPLLLFASSKETFNAFLQQIARDPTYHIYLYFAFVVQPDVIKEDATMTRIVENLLESPYLTERNLKIVAQDLGHHFMRFITDVSMLQESPAFQNFLQENKIQNFLAAEQRTLIRLLRRRFETVPDEIVAQIEATTEQHLLEQWQDSLFDISTIGEFETLMTRSTQKQGD